MELYMIEQFLQLCKFEHMSETADFLNISQPALSKTISRLEHELGVKLFDRVGRNIRLNRNGENFRDYATQSLRYLNAGILSTQSTRSDVLGHIQVRCYAFAPVLMDCISAYSAQNPYINFSIYQSTPSTQLPNDQMDFLLCASSPLSFQENSEHVWIPQPLRREGHHLIISKEHPVQKRITAPPQLSDYREATFVAMAQHDLFYVDPTFLFCKMAGFIPQITFRTDNFQIKLELVRRGLAAAFIPDSCLENAMRQCDNLFALPASLEQTDRTLTLMHRRESFMSKEALDFWNFVLEYYHIEQKSRK